MNIFAERIFKPKFEPKFASNFVTVNIMQIEFCILHQRKNLEKLN